MPPASKTTGKATQRTRRTKAQIEEDLIAAGVPSSGSRATPAAIKRSHLAAKKRASVSMATTTRNIRDSPPFDTVDYQTIVAYISNPRIRNALFGGGSRTRVTGLPMAPNAILNSLAIKLNNSYNIRHNTTDMRLNGRVLSQRLKRYKSKYCKTKAFSLQTGSGLSAKNAADGIHTMEDLLESMCPCFNEMDVIFRDNPNINPFGVLDTGVAPPVSDDDDDDDTQGNINLYDGNSEGSTTDGHDHSFVGNQTGENLSNHSDLPAQIPNWRNPTGDLPDPIPSPGPEELQAHQEILNAQPQSPNLNAHYRACVDNDDNSSFPPTPKGLSFDLAPVAPVSAVGVSAPSAHAEKPNRKISKRKASKKDDLTPEERALDSSSDEDPHPASSSKPRGATRATLSSQAIDPLPSIDPSTVRGKNYKHPVATAMQLGNAAKIDMLRAANQWRQEFDAAKQQAELAARQSDLSWAKEKFFLEREEERTRLAMVTRNKRKAFCEKLVLEGKTPQELEAYLRLVYPSENPLPIGLA